MFSIFLPILCAIILFLILKTGIFQYFKQQNYVVEENFSIDVEAEITRSAWWRKNEQLNYADLDFRKKIFFSSDYLSFNMAMHNKAIQEQILKILAQPAVQRIYINDFKLIVELKAKKRSKSKLEKEKNSVHLEIIGSVRLLIKLLVQELGTEPDDSKEDARKYIKFINNARYFYISFLVATYIQFACVSIELLGHVMMIKNIDLFSVTLLALPIYILTSSYIWFNIKDSLRKSALYFSHFVLFLGTLIFFSYNIIYSLNYLMDNSSSDQYIVNYMTHVYRGKHNSYYLDIINIKEDNLFNPPINSIEITGNTYRALENHQQATINVHKGFFNYPYIDKINPI